MLGVLHRAPREMAGEKGQREPRPLPAHGDQLPEIESRLEDPPELGGGEELEMRGIPIQLLPLEDVDARLQVIRIGDGADEEAPGREDPGDLVENDVEIREGLDNFTGHDAVERG